MLLITQSLLSSWGYMFNCWEDGQEQAKEDFLRSLRREPIPPTESMIDGVAFEKAVYAEASGVWYPEIPKWDSGIKQVADIIRGAQIQVSIRRTIEVDGEKYLLHGILDALKAGTIYDVKYKYKSFGSLDLAGSYLESPQHPAYFYLVPEARNFKYLVSDGTDLYVEEYNRQSSPYIGDLISEFKTSVKEMGLYDLYKQKWEVR